jgi:4a-hydroxytetrahydrobiopterin dehydratase
VALADDATVERALATLDGWSRDGGALVRQLEFPGFREAIDFIVRVADLAEAADHHPELSNVYSRVTVRLTSHDAGGITDRDLDLARAIDGVVSP